jgi:hypothetical protein
MWELQTTIQYEEWASALDEAAQDRIFAIIELLREFGPQLKRPHADTLSGSKHPNMKELRVETATQKIRIAFAFDPLRNAILLIGGEKQGVSQKLFYKQLIKLADRLFDEHLESLDR